MASLKTIIRNRLNALGIEFRKFPSAPFTPVSVFNLSVQLLMAKQGNAIKFVQVGANDGVFGDPLRHYVLAHPWRGILVEPQPDVFQRLKENYAACADRLIFENVAISSETSDFVLYKAPDSLLKAQVYDSSVVSSDPRIIAKQLKINPNKMEKITVPTLTLSELIAKNKFIPFDVLQIDAEGYDYQVLKTLDLRAAAPTIIQFESGHLSRADCSRAVEYLTAHDYQIYWGGYQGDAVALKRGFVLEAAS